MDGQLSWRLPVPKLESLEKIQIHGGQPVGYFGVRCFRQIQHHFAQTGWAVLDHSHNPLHDRSAVSPNRIVYLTRLYMNQSTEESARTPVYCKLVSWTLCKSTSVRSKAFVTRMLLFG
jgi:hypothetical protein